MKDIFQITAILLASISALIGILFFIRLRWPAPAWWILKLYASALSPFFVLIGILSTIVGLATGSALVDILGIYVTLIFGIHLYGITRPPGHSGGFEKVFGLQWKSSLPTAISAHFLPTRAGLGLPPDPEPRLHQNIAFATLPGTGRELLCDIWQPPGNVASSGLAFIYVHGSAFYLLDKDFGTRPFFRRLAAQGHLVMDVAYRLSPETDIMGMVHDVNRAIAWMKENAGTYGVNPNLLVLGGGSSGGHLALLAAYTTRDQQFRPKELEGRDLNTCAVISLYGSNDLEALYYHTNQHLTSRSIAGRAEKAVPKKMPGWIIRKMGDNYHRLGFDKDFEKTGALVPLLGGTPDECPGTYAYYSPVTHVHPTCPATLLIHGNQDVLVPVDATRRLYARLVGKGVPAILHIFPQTEHGFDLVLPRISPAARNAIYDVERFLALQVGMQKSVAKRNQGMPGIEARKIPTHH